MLSNFQGMQIKLVSGQLGPKQARLLRQVDHQIIATRAPNLHPHNFQFNLLFMTITSN